ncbi:Alpha/beta hydrolase fold-3 [Niveomyces insectorum RCEF 264]|uniref:Alpha/beta hydrolase fold-3 n=1 Tax=Niveomyces insectorum RCEF 264 TaxID=1081102 RepID=A0A167XAI4_9HYPO|nr:Alpha/beta hydrolase fold-3 [Niveomyces insectorum RCEF 264]
MSSSKRGVSLLVELFDRVDVPYKGPNGTPFTAAILVPRALKAATKTCPLIAHFHGGGLYMGTNPEPSFLSRWSLELAVTKNAIIVSPAYRLLPEATGTDILQDVLDFWDWVRTSLPTSVAATWPDLTVDLTSTAVLGESAGGYLSLLSAFHQPAGTIQVAMAQYCSIFPDIDAWRPQPVDGGPADAHALIDNYLATIPPGALVVSRPFPAMLDFGLACLKTGRYREWMGPDERLTLAYGLRTAKQLPPIWVLQGLEDSLVPRAATDSMVERIRKVRPETPLLYSVQPGDHGFDEAHALDEPYVAEGLAFVTKYWPKTV